MAAKKYTADELLDMVRDRAMIPDSGATGSEDADLLSWIDEGTSLYLLPLILKVREDYFVQRERTALGTASAYRIPHRAAYNKLKNLWYSDGSERHRIDKVPESLRHHFSDSKAGTPCGYFLEGDYVNLLPEGGGSFSGYLEFVYYMRPQQLVKAASAGVVLSVNAAQKQITCTASVAAVFAQGNKIDVHSPYSGAELKEWDLTVTNVTDAVLTVSEVIDGTVFGRKGAATGDYVCLAEQAVIPTLPKEFHPMVARAAALAFAESIGDDDGIKRHGSILGKQLADAGVCLESRVESKPLRLGSRGWA